MALLLIAASSLTSLAIGCGGHRGGTTPSVAHGLRAVQREVGYDIYWDGPTVRGLSLTKVSRGAGSTTLIYGSCTPQPAGDEASCTPPLQIEVASLCDRNALLLDVRPSSHRVSRGASVLTYGDERLELAAGESTVVISAKPSLAHRALAALRPFERRRRATLPSARYPRYYVAQLRRVDDTYTRQGGANAVRRELGISRSAARFELALARELGAARLHRSGHAGATLRQVKRDRLAAALVDAQGERSAGDALGMSLQQVRASAERGRERRRGCALEPQPR